MEQKRSERRVWGPELAERCGFTPTWLRVLERKGRIPPARRDPGSRRKFWLESEADSIVAGTVTKSTSA